MLNLPRILIGLFLFNIGYIIPTIGIAPMLIGGYMLSRLMVDDFNAPFYFFLGLFITIPSFFMLVPFFEKNGWENAQVVKYLFCICGSVTTWLSVKK